MRTLPPNMQDRLDAAMQTLYANADPRLEIIISRQQRWIGAGALLTPATIRTETSLGPIDVAVRREDPTVHLDHLVMAYIEDGVAHTALCYDIEFATDPDYWFYEAEIGPADDVAIEFDGYWVRRAGRRRRLWWELDKSRWTHVTEGDPWILRVLPNGTLLARQGVAGADTTLVATTDVTQVRALRGWKSVVDLTDDHGVVALYIRGGDVYYRNYAEGPVGTWSWAAERAVTEFDTSVDPAENVGIFRTNDFRFGMLAEIDGDIYMATTERNWAGMALDSEKIAASIQNYTVRNLLPEGGYRTELLDVSVENYDLRNLWGVDIAAVDAENVEESGDWGLRIVVTFAWPVDERVGNHNAFAVTDSNAVNFNVQATAAGPTEYDVLLTVADFNAAVGDITVDYDDTGPLIGGAGTAGQDTGVTSVTFTPANLVPPVEDAPEPEEITNE